MRNWRATICFSTIQIMAFDIKLSDAIHDKRHILCYMVGCQNQGSLAPATRVGGFGVATTARHGDAGILESLWSRFKKADTLSYLYGCSVMCWNVMTGSVCL